MYNKYKNSDIPTPTIINQLDEDESLHKWFKRSGPKGKEGGWVDCNAPIRKDGKITGKLDMYKLELAISTINSLPRLLEAGKRALNALIEKEFKKESFHNEDNSKEGTLIDNKFVKYLFRCCQDYLEEMYQDFFQPSNKAFYNLLFNKNMFLKDPEVLTLIRRSYFVNNPDELSSGSIIFPEANVFMVEACARKDKFDQEISKVVSSCLGNVFDAITEVQIGDNILDFAVKYVSSDYFVSKTEAFRKRNLKFFQPFTEMKQSEIDDIPLQCTDIFNEYQDMINSLFSEFAKENDIDVTDIFRCCKDAGTCSMITYRFLYQQYISLFS
jgi:hypothetical protein